MTHTAIPTGLVHPAIPRPDAMRLAATAYQRFAAAIAELSDEDWERPTDCAEWDVRAMVAHVGGMADFAASPLEMRRQLRLAKASGREPSIDALTQLQVEEHVHLSPTDLVAAARRSGDRAARGRRRTPGLIRRRRLPEPQVVNGRTEFWSIGFLTDVILTRDTWLHRIDVCRATSREPVLTAEHDGRIVADVVAEWAARHGRPYRLTLTGPAGGTWASGDDGDLVVMDAVDFCRTLSGRAHGTGLLSTEVPF
ncbi:maleylpyruvate isomerase family mycothiol-dependent enzyme [Nocardioides sp.]|uniref:maleylpyruvate isomerase family mycothiol-dependent enzyme n=1 Tax=Nocardioides sp. TaxID=35761 RepID=UPI002732BFEE|nr:maleylpyruvate isomerase family mycothiol-dependent enzyme [Nocardioides sp.]MDP3892375.1 maleylpyruvate isomerase family mycothiol-dependent enzyme [Nocardioides sp.]